MAKVQITVKAVQAANAKMLNRAHGVMPDRQLPLSVHVQRPASPSRAAIAQAGQKALQSFKRQPA